MLNPKSIFRLTAVLGMAGALAACGDDPPSEPPTPGNLQATLVSPNGGEGAVLLELTGTPVRSVTLPGGGRAFVEGTDPARVLLVFPEPGTVQFSVGVDDVNRPPRARVIEVADAANQPRASVSGYRVEFDR